MVILEVDPPMHNGGKPITGYRVEFGRKMTDYAVGLCPLTYLLTYFLVLNSQGMHIAQVNVKRLSPEE